MKKKQARKKSGGDAPDTHSSREKTRPPVTRHEVRSRRSQTRKLAKTYRTSGALVSLIADIGDTVETAADVSRSLEDRIAGIGEFLDGGMEGASRSEETLGDLRDGGGRLIDAVMDSSGAARTVMNRFTGRIGVFERRLSGVNALHERFSAMKDHCDALRKAAEPATELAERLRKNAEHAEVAAMNVSLAVTRGKSTDEGVERLAEKAGKAATDYLEIAGGLADAMEDLVTGVAGYAERRTAVATRYRTVTAMAKSIASAFDDTGASLSAMTGNVEGAADHAAEIGPVADDLADAFGNLAAAAEICGDGFDEMLAFIRGQGDLFGPVKECAADLNELARRLPDDPAAVSDAMCDVAEEIAGHTEKALSVIGEIQLVFDEAAGDAPDFVELSERVNAGVSGLPDHIAGLGKAAADLGGDMHAARERLEDMESVVNELLSELNGLMGERKSLGAALARIRSALRRIARRHALCAPSLGRIDGCSLAGSILSGGMGEKKGDIGPYLAELDAIVTDGFAVLGSLSGCCEAVDTAADVLDEGDGYRDIGVLAEAVRTLADDIAAMLAGEFTGAEDAVAVIADIAAEMEDTAEKLAATGVPVADIFSRAAGEIGAVSDELGRLAEYLDDLDMAAGRTVSTAAGLAGEEE